MTYAKIIGCGSYLPPNIVSNHDLAKSLDTSDEWIVSRTGIERRHIVGDDETTASMSFNAAKAALANASFSANDLDMIIVATCTPDSFLPSTACHVQRLLGISKAIPCFDVSVACAGFVYALSIADQFIRNGTMKNILVIGAEVMSRIVDWTDRSTCILFGDGAGAVVLTASNKPGIHSSHLHAQGEYGNLLYLHNEKVQPGATRQHESIHMAGQEVFKLAVSRMGDVVTETIEANPDVKHVDWLVPHQANLRIIGAIAKRLSLPMDKVILTIADHGNTSAASIPMALDVGLQDGRIKPGHTILMEAFGGGLTWGSVLATM